MKLFIVLFLSVVSTLQAFSQTDLLTYNIQSQNIVNNKIFSEKTETVDIDQFIKKVIKTYHKQINKKPYIAKAYYKEKSKIDGNYQMYTDGMGYLVSLGYDYMIPTDNFSYLCFNMRKSNRKKEWINLMQNLYKTTSVQSQTDFVPGYNSIFNCFRFFEIYGPFNRKNIKEYSFTLKETIKKQNRIIYKISFEYKNPNLEFVDLNYKGFFYADSETSHIYRIVFNEAPFYSEPYRKRLKSEFEVNFKFFNNKSFFSKLKSYYKVNNVEHWVEFKVLEKQFHTVEISKSDYRVFPDIDSCPWVRYNEQDWSTYGFPEEKDMEKIKNDLGSEIPLKKQYQKNADKLFYKAVFPDHEDYEKRLKQGDKHILKKIKEYEKYK